MSEDMHKIAFISPFPLENCIRRLESRNEKGQILAWDWQRRMKARARQIDEHRADFRLLFIPRSWLDIEFSMSPRARGRLERLKDDRTAVVGEVRLPLWISLLTYIAGVVMTFSMAASFILDPEIEANPVLVVALAGGFLLVYVLFFWWWTDHSIRILKRTVQESLGDPDFVQKRR